MIDVVLAFSKSADCLQLSGKTICRLIANKKLTIPKVGEYFCRIRGAEFK